MKMMLFLDRSWFTVLQSITVLGIWLTSAQLHAARTTIVAASDMQIPDGRELSEPGTPIISAQGDVVFTSILRRDGFLRGSGLFRANASPGSLKLVLNEGHPSPDFNGYFSSFQFSTVYLNRAGDMALEVGFTGTLGGGSDSTAIYRLNQAGNITQIVRSGDRIPGSERRFPSFDNRLAINGGQVAFRLSGTQGNVFDYIAIYRADGTNLSRIVRADDPVPGVSNSAFEDFTIGFSQEQFLTINESGQVLFVGSDDDLKDGYYLHDPVHGTNIAKIVREDDALPTGAGQFFSLNAFPVLNDSGEIAFVADLWRTDLGTADNEGVFRATAAGVTQIARKGDFVPDRNGRYLDIFPDVALNNRGEVLFTANITGAGSASIAGLFIADHTGIRTIARTGDPAPGGGRFQGMGLETCALNNLGQAVFGASVTGAGDVRGGLYFYDPVLGIFPVVRIGENLLDRGNVSNLYFDGSTRLAGRQRCGFNDRGEVAYRALASEYLIAIWSPAGLAENRPPIVSPGGFTTQVSQGQSLQIAVSNLLSVVTDPDGGNLSLASITNRTSQGQELTYNQFSQSYSYFPPSGFTGSDEFTYAVKDEDGASVSVIARINVLPVNRTPTTTNLTLAARAGETVAISIASILAAASDPDGDQLSLAMVPTNTVRGGVIVRRDDSLLVTPILTGGRTFVPGRRGGAGGRASDSFTCRVEDGRGGSVNLVVSIYEREDRIPNGLEGVQRTNSVIAFTITSDPSTAWTIERADDLDGPWTPVGQVTTPSATTGYTSVEFQDQSLSPRRAFYRGRR